MSAQSFVCTLIVSPQWSCNNWSFGSLWSHRLFLIALFKFRPGDQVMTKCSPQLSCAMKGIKPTFQYGTVMSRMTDRWRKGWMRGKSLLLHRSDAGRRSIIRRRASIWHRTSVAAARLGCGRAADRLSSDLVDSPVPLMAASLVWIQASSGAQPLISPSADSTDYTGCRVTLIETSEDIFLKVQFVMCVILVLDSAQWEADVVSGMFMFWMPETLLLAVLRSVRNLLTLKP